MGLARRIDTARSLRAPRPEWLPYHLPAIGEEEIAEVVDTLRSGWLTTGAKAHRFERDLAAFLGVPEVLALSSGTAALHLALRVCGVLPGDDVVVPSYTFTATAEAVTYVGARPVLADVDPVTGNLRAEDVARVLTPRVRAVMPVHVAGRPCEMGPILALARDAGLLVVEDAAHALEAHAAEGPCGTLGDAGAYSFYATKTITTGEGGALVIRDAARREQARLLALNGISRDAWKRYARAGSWRYEVVAAGHKYNLPTWRRASASTSSRRRRRSSRGGARSRGATPARSPASTRSSCRPSRSRAPTPGTSTCCGSARPCCGWTATPSSTRSARATSAPASTSSRCTYSRTTSRCGATGRGSFPAPSGRSPAR